MKRSIQAAAQRRFGHLGAGRARAEDIPGPTERADAQDGEDETLPCRTCNGTGDVPGADGETDDCPTCGGAGEEDAEECPRCEGDGKEPETDESDGVDCTRCNGNGAVYEDGTAEPSRDAKAFAGKVLATKEKLQAGASKPLRVVSAPAASRRGKAADGAQAFAGKMADAMKKVRP